ncbi:hypothetical protein ACFLXH_03885 [Chloroflexota bacterium]
MAKIIVTIIAHSKSLPLLSLILALMLSPFTMLFPQNTTLAATDTVKWSRVNIPTEGDGGDWVLAANSDIKHLHMATDGILFAYGEGLTLTLYRSENGGYNWSPLGDVRDEIVDITTAPGEDYAIYYATDSLVYRSTDDGKTFQALPANPGEAGNGGLEITSIAVTRNGSNLIALGTRDTDSAQFGGIYLLDEDDIIPQWENTNIGNYDIYSIAFSPHYPADGQLVAVVTDEIDTYVTSKIGVAGWGNTAGNARLDKDNSGSPTPVTVAHSATISFPGDYDADPASGNSVFFIGIDTGNDNGDVYKIALTEAPGSSTAVDLNVAGDYGLNNTDITGLAVSGEIPTVNLLAGAADSAQTYFSNDAGESWLRSRQSPTGGSKTHVIMGDDFASTQKVYAATSGSGSAFSVSQDRGGSWQQTSLIDTEISTLLALAPSPQHDEDNTLFLLTFGNSAYSLWRTHDDGIIWERIFSSNLASVDSLGMVDLPRQYDLENQVIFIAGVSNGRPAVWKSDDNGQNFNRRLAVDPDSGGLLDIDTWAIVDENTLYIGTYNGSAGRVYRTANSGFFYSTGVEVGSQSLSSIVLSPDYEQDRTILVGNSNGWVYRSDDDGNSFTPLPADANSAPLTGTISIAFDTAFSSNKVVYAAGSTADAGIHRFVIGSSNEWESIDSSLPSGGTLTQVVITGNSTMYSANSDADAGMERSLNPTYSLGPTFESVTRGLSDGATLSGLWQQGHRLWTTDTTNNRLLTFYDSLTIPCQINEPTGSAQGVGTLTNHTVKNVTLDWETLPGATSYQWQLDDDTDFSSVPSGFEGTTKASSVRLTDLDPDTTYYWRVRASEPILSKWAAKQSFTTSLDTETIALKLENPGAGITDVPINPVFQWNAVAGAVAYELLIATSTDFGNPSIVRTGEYALETTAWQCDMKLNPDTTYYWKVRARNHNTYSDWSAVSAFTTLALSSLPETTPTPKVSPPAQQPPPPPEPLVPLKIASAPQTNSGPATHTPGITTGPGAAYRTANYPRDADLGHLPHRGINGYHHPVTNHYAGTCRGHKALLDKIWYH